MLAERSGPTLSREELVKIESYMCRAGGTSEAVLILQMGEGKCTDAELPHLGLGPLRVRKGRMAQRCTFQQLFSGPCKLHDQAHQARGKKNYINTTPSTHTLNLSVTPGHL